MWDAQRDDREYCGEVFDARANALGEVKAETLKMLKVAAGKKMRAAGAVYCFLQVTHTPYFAKATPNYEYSRGKWQEYKD